MNKAELDQLAERVIGLAIEVHRHLGPGLLESIYEAALCHELTAAGLPFERQKALPVIYKGQTLGEFRADLVVGNALLLELKSVERHEPLFEAQVLTYLKISHLQLGLLLNFNTRLLKDGIKRLILT
ncbi:MAG: GxxExxY protein [Opitutaceae bacterium]|nr:GxxExxY protein [Opitutaceae bacterium]